MEDAKVELWRMPRWSCGGCQGGVEDAKVKLWRMPRWSGEKVIKSHSRPVDRLQKA